MKSTSAPSTSRLANRKPTRDADAGGRYRITAEHSRGGLGRVLRASDEALGREVAVKELLVATPENEARFLHEAVITARLQHPSIVPVHDAGRWPSGDPYYVMKLVGGNTLKEKIAEAETLSDRLALIPNAIAVADAIAYAHSLSILHRDIKPSNVVVGEFGETIVVDWGLALDLGVSDPGSTEDGVVGTPAYMSPEQARAATVDKRSDVHSLGALLYHLLTGEAPYADSPCHARIKAVIAGPPKSITAIESNIPAELVAIVTKAMAPAMDDRYRDAAAFSADLKRYRTGHMVFAKSYSTIGLVKHWLSRHRAAASAAVATIAITAVLGALAVAKIIAERNTAQRERSQALSAHTASEERRQALVFLQAQSSLLRDPTATVAWLKDYPPQGPRGKETRALAEQARAFGVASSVLDVGEWVIDARFVDSDTIATVEKGGVVRIWDLKNATLRALEGITSLDGALSVSPQGRQLAYPSPDGRIFVVDLEQGSAVTLSGHKDWVGLLVFSKDGRFLTSSGGDQVVRVWDLSTAQPSLELMGDGGSGRGNVSRDGQRIAWISGGVLRWREVTDRRWRNVPVVADTSIRRLAVAPNEPIVATVGGDNVITTFSLESGERKEVGVHHDEAANLAVVTHFEFSPSGRFLVSTGEDRTVRVWDLDNDSHRVFRGHQDSVYMADFSPDEASLVSASDDGTARLWDLRTGATRVLRGHTDDVYRARFSADGDQVATASLDGTVRVWPTRVGDSQLLPHGEPVAEVAFRQENALVTQSLGGELSRWELASGRRTVVGRAWQGDSVPDWRAKKLALISASGKLAAAVRSDGGIDVWKTAGGDEQLLTPPSEVGELVALAFSVREQRLLASDGEGRLVSWPLVSGEPSVSRTPPIKALSYAPDGTLAMVTPSELILAEPGGADIIHPLRGPGPSGGLDDFYLVVSAHGDRFAAFTSMGHVTVCTRTRGGCRDFSTAGERISAAAFSPDGEKIAVALADRTVLLWNVTTGFSRTFRGHTDLVHDVTFSPNGKQLASASYDRTVRLWDLASGDPRVLRAHSESVDSIAYSPSGDRLASASRDGSVRVWTTSKPRGADEGVLETMTSAAIENDRPISPVGRALPR